MSHNAIRGMETYGTFLQCLVICSQIHGYINVDERNTSLKEREL
jgi:hypothetical protein